MTDVKESVFNYTPFKQFVKTNGGEVTFVNTVNNNAALIVGGAFIAVKNELKPNLDHLVKSQAELLVVGTTKAVDEYGKHKHTLFMQGGVTVIESITL